MINPQTDFLELLANPVQNKEAIYKILTNLDQQYQTPLNQAIDKDNIEIVKKILSFLSLNPNMIEEIIIDTSPGSYSFSALDLAIISNRTEIVTEFLSFLSSYPEILCRAVTQQNIFYQSIFSSSIQNNNLVIVKEILLLLSTRSDIIHKIFTEKNQFGYFTFNRAIIPKRINFLSSSSTADISKNIEILKEILSFLSSYPDIMKEVFKQRDEDDLAIIDLAIDSENPEIVQEILSFLKSYPDLLYEVLMQKDKNGYSVSHLAINSGDVEMLKEILYFLSSYPDLLYEVLMQKNKFGFSVFQSSISLQRVEIVQGILSFLSAYPDLLYEALMQKNKFGLSVFHLAINSGNIEIVQEILLSSDHKIRDFIFEQKDSNKNKTLIVALDKIFTNDDEDNKEPEEILKLLIKNKFAIDLNESKISTLISYFKHHTLLGLMTQKKYGLSDIKNQNVLCKILNEVILSSQCESLKTNPISQIYLRHIVKVDSNQPILIGDNQALYLYNSQTFRHSSYLIFNVDCTTNKIKSISYCDGNFFYRLFDTRPNTNSLISRRVFGVREFEFDDDIEFCEEFAKKFIRKNFKFKNINLLQLPFTVDSGDLKVKKIRQCIDTKQQSRGNCSFKSANILARYLLEKIEKRDFSRDYQHFKETLRFEVINCLVNDYKEIKKQFSEEFVKHLEIQERLEGIAGLKFSQKQSGLISSAISDIKAIDLASKSRSSRHARR